jgi:hypothetical protein
MTPCFTSSIATRSSLWGLLTARSSRGKGAATQLLGTLCRDVDEQEAARDGNGGLNRSVVTGLFDVCVLCHATQ